MAAVVLGPSLLLDVARAGLIRTEQVIAAALDEPRAGQGFVEGKLTGAGVVLLLLITSDPFGLTDVVTFIRGFRSRPSAASDRGGTVRGTISSRISFIALREERPYTGAGERLADRDLGAEMDRRTSSGFRIHRHLGPFRRTPRGRASRFTPPGQTSRSVR